MPPGLPSLALAPSRCVHGACQLTIWLAEAD